MKQSCLIFLQGQIQGVGFRPFVSCLAHSLELKGYVKNIGLGVEILLQGERIEEFLHNLPLKAPKISKIHTLKVSYIQAQDYDSFLILQSEGNQKIAIPPIPDLALCQDCKNDLFYQENRRYFYPLINCTNCGPRFSVIQSFPYDRERTSMQYFVMCEDCKKQYSNLSNRFYHAQPISCPKCSPKVFWRGEERKDFWNVFQEMADEIKKGEILCIQGIGGFHLVCDATNAKTIQQLREIKKRPNKPLALICKDIQQVRSIAYLSLKEEEILQSKEAPIVLLESKKNLLGIARDRYGVMLAYTPIYELLFHFLQSPLVATSANLKGEPILYQASQLKSLNLPLIFSHQREILNPIEDSIVQVLSTQDVMVLRCARGYAPLVFRLDFKIPYPILALGANQKVSFAFAFEDFVILSPYIGDLDNLSTLERLKQSLEYFKTLYQLDFQEIICDLHPAYESTKLAFELSDSPIQIQHHYAHLLSVCFEYKIRHKVLGFCFDGTGYGNDKTIWGGEVLLADLEGFERKFYFKPFMLLGGDLASKEIGRNFFALLYPYLCKEERFEFFASRGMKQNEFETLELMYQKKINSLQTSSVGRIFDGIAWLCGLERQSYEGESGEFIQSLYDERIHSFYHFEFQNEEIVLDVVEIYNDSFVASASLIASKFLNTLIEIIISLAMQFQEDIVLCGGVFCNKILSSKVLEILREKKRKCYVGNQIPPNDNGVGIGQLYYLIHQIQRRKNAR